MVDFTKFYCYRAWHNVESRPWKSCCKCWQLLLTFVNTSSGAELTAPKLYSLKTSILQSMDGRFLEVQLLNSELEIDCHGCLRFDQSFLLKHECSSREIKPLWHIAFLMMPECTSGKLDLCANVLVQIPLWLSAALQFDCDNNPVASCQFRFLTCCPWREDEHAIRYHLKDESNTKPLINKKNTWATVSSNMYFVVRINTSVSSRLLTASIFGLVSLFSSSCKCRE